LSEEVQNFNEISRDIRDDSLGEEKIGGRHRTQEAEREGSDRKC
jgi:hypothetical protein